MNKIKVAILKGRRELSGSSGVDYFLLNLYQELKKNHKINVSLVHGNYFLPSLFKFFPFGRLDQFDIVHNGIPGLGIFIGTKKPIITTFYDDIMFQPEIFTQRLTLFNKLKTIMVKEVWRLLLAYDIRRSNQIIAISEYSKKALIDRLKIDREKISVIPPGVDTQVYKPLKQVMGLGAKNTLRLFYCGRICFRKGTDLLLMATKILKEKIPQVKIKLYLAGKIDGTFNLQQEVKHLGLEEEIIYLGSLTNQQLAQQYRLAKVFVFPSRVEGYGIPPLEALACGTKVVSTKIPSTQVFSEIIKVQTSAESIAEGILSAIKKDINIDSTRKKIVKNLSLQTTAKAYIKAYCQLLTQTKNYEESTINYTKMLKHSFARDKKRLFRYFQNILPNINKMLPRSLSKNTVNILDIGCGIGMNLNFLVSKGFKNLWGIDINRYSLKEAKINCPSAKIKYGDVYLLPFKENSFDLIILTEVIEHLDQSSKAIKEINRVLRPGGVLFLTTPNRMGLMGLSNGPIKFLLKGFWWKSILRIWGKITCGPEHPKEYFAFELAKTLKKEGFGKIRFPNYCYIPLFPSGKYYLIAQKT